MCYRCLRNVLEYLFHISLYLYISYYIIIFKSLCSQGVQT
nr:MAG TPA: hypothetical protein [Bacteriophage sp.]